MILAKCGEIVLKGLNRSHFDSILLKNLKDSLKDLGKFDISLAQSTVYVRPLDDADMDEVFERTCRVFGFAAVCRAYTCEKSMDAILACEKAGVNIRIAAPLLKFNRHAFPMLKRFTEEHNMYLVPDFNIIARANHDDGNLKYACSAEELEEVLQENKDIFDMGWSCVCRDDPEATLCDIGMYRLHLNSEGDFYPCPSMYGYVLGNLNEKSLNAIWKCERLEYLRNLKWKNLSHCMICEHRNFCEPCIAYNFNATGDMFKTIPQKCQAAEVIHRIYGE